MPAVEHAPVGDAVVDEVVGEGELVGVRAAAQQARAARATSVAKHSARPVVEGEQRAPAELVLREQAAARRRVPDDEGEGPADVLEQPLLPARVARGASASATRCPGARPSCSRSAPAPSDAPRHARQARPRCAGRAPRRPAPARRPRRRSAPGSARRSRSPSLPVPRGSWTPASSPVEQRRHHARALAQRELGVAQHGVGDVGRGRAGARADLVERDAARDRGAATSSWRRRRSGAGEVRQEGAAEQQRRVVRAHRRRSRTPRSSAGRTR